MMQDPAFVKYSETLYSNMMKDPSMARVMQSMQNPNARSQMESRMKALKDDPEVLSKIGKKMQGVIGAEGAQGPGAEAPQVVEEEVDLHGAVSDSDVASVKELI